MIILAVLVLMCGCREKGQIEYDNATGTVVDMTAYGIDSHHFHFITFDDLFQLFDSKKTTIVYIGHEGCPWCETLVPELDKICDEFGYDIYYLDTLHDLNVGNEKALERLAELCKDHVTPDTDGTPVIWAPSVLYIRRGEVIDVHEGTVNTHDAREREMTEKERARLQYMLDKEIRALTEVK